MMLVKNKPAPEFTEDYAQDRATELVMLLRRGDQQDVERLTRMTVILSNELMLWRHAGEVMATRAAQKVVDKTLKGVKP